MLFMIVNGVVGTAGGYLMFKQFRNLGLLAAGGVLTVGSLVSMGMENWWPMMASVPLAILAVRVIGDPAEA